MRRPIYRRVVSHNDLWEGDTIKTSYGTGPYVVEKILIDEQGLAYLTLSVSTERHLPGHQYDQYYLNGYKRDPDAWRQCNGDTFHILSKPADGLQHPLFDLASTP